MSASDFDRYRKPPGFRSYRVFRCDGSDVPWRVLFFVDGEEVGGGRFQTSSQADDAGVDFMFSGWGEG